jgi:hypothetical protein
LLLEGVDENVWYRTLTLHRPAKRRSLETCPTGLRGLQWTGSSTEKILSDIEGLRANRQTMPSGCGF